MTAGEGPNGGIRDMRDAARVVTATFGADAPGGEPPDDGDSARPVEFSDDAVAAAFSARHGDDVVHVAAHHRWLRWDGRRYNEDQKLWVVNAARQVCRDMARAAPPRVATVLSSAKTIYAVTRLAASDKRHARAPEEFDLDPWSLNTPDGVVDLKSGRLCPHSKSFLMSKMTRAGVAQVPNACPAWTKFMHDATRGDRELVEYLQRIAGYVITGSIKEHSLFFAYGPGGNGKSVFLTALTEMLGDYAVTAPMDVFTVSRGERHPTELAMLRGARLVAASETEEGKRWDEAKLKAITGGDPITARYMRGDFFTFSPAFKLVMAGNYRPGIRSVDPAMRRRMNILPFFYKPPKPDKTLPDRLRQEYAGILAWAIQGSLMWQAQGLAPPPSVIQATNDYFDVEDAMGRWLGERCERSPEATTLSRSLYADWKRWAEDAGEYVGSEKRFAQLLEQRGFDRWREPHTRQRGFRGVATLAPPGELPLSQSSRPVRPSEIGMPEPVERDPDEREWEA